MKIIRGFFLLLMLIGVGYVVLMGFGQQNVSATKYPDTQQDSETQQDVDQDSSNTPTVNSLAARLVQSADQKERSIESVRRVDDHPLYVMTYYGDYDCEKPLLSQSTLNDGVPGSLADTKRLSWACSLFVSFGDADRPLYGRNFDWEDNPAMLLYTDPSDGYASISMVDVSYLGYSKKDPQFDESESRRNLLVAPMIPFDGMNEHGLVVGMAAVPDSRQPFDESKTTVGGLQIIRMMLDKTKSVEEALELFRSHNVQFSGGPNIHYLIADADANSSLVELKDGKLIITKGKGNWDSATNFHLDGSEGKGNKLCRRYAQIETQMKKSRGELDVEESFDLLKSVAQPSTRWSVVYDMKGRSANVAMSRKFSEPQEFSIKSLEPTEKN